MIEVICIITIITSGTFWYLKQNDIHKNKIQFDLLEDRGIKKMIK